MSNSSRHIHSFLYSKEILVHPRAHTSEYCCSKSENSWQHYRNFLWTTNTSNFLDFFFQTKQSQFVIMKNLLYCYKLITKGRLPISYTHIMPQLWDTSQIMSMKVKNKPLFSSQEAFRPGPPNTSPPEVDVVVV